MTCPAQKPGKSPQDCATPPKFVAAVQRLIAPVALTIDLAATFDNAKCLRWIEAEQDSLAQDWVQSIPDAIRFPEEDAAGWLNPPFERIDPWVAKAKSTAAAGGRVVMLVPASVGSTWWAEHVHGFARVVFPRPRIAFLVRDLDGVYRESGPYPKDCALLMYGWAPEYALWRWDA